MKYELRNLCSKDIFPMSKILTKIGLTELKTSFEGDQVLNLIKGGKNIETIGVSVALNIAGIILTNLSCCETEIYRFLSDLTGAKVEELKECSLADFAELIVGIVQKDEFKDFIGVVSKLSK